MKIIKEINIHPVYLNNLHKHIDNIVINKIVKVCDIEYGYITKVNSFNIIDNDISRTNSDIIIKIELDIENFKPELGKHYPCNIVMIYNTGIFVEILNCQKALIPIHFLKENVVFNDNKNCLEDENGNVIHSIGDEIKICLKGVRYTNKMFNCFGTLI